MNKLEQVKQAISNPPPDRLAKVEYQSHFLQILGVIVVCSILIMKGFWYIIFALIFSVGVSYSQGITAYQKHKAIREIMGKPNYENVKSPTRRKHFIINSVYGNAPYWFTILISVQLTYFLVGVETWTLKLAFPFLTIFLFCLLYYYPIYYLANRYYRREE